MSNIEISAEEFAVLKESIRRLEEKVQSKKERLKYNLNGGLKGLEKSGHGFYNVDDEDEVVNSYLKDQKKLEDLKNVLNTSRLIAVSSKNKFIDKGRRFSVRFVGSDIDEDFIIGDNLDGKSSLDGYITMDSAFAQSVMGKCLGDFFHYEINGLEYSGVITHIGLEYGAHFMKEKEANRRVCRKAVLWRKGMLTEDKEALKIMTPSQMELLKEYEERLYRGACSSCIKLDIANLSYFLKKYKVVRESPFVQDENQREIVNKRIGYGTSFSMMIFQKERTITKRVEMIYLALSTETTMEYIERVSSLGFAIFGLEENSEFSVPQLGISGIVYDVDNSLYEDRFITSNPFVYQRNRKRR